MKASAFVLFQHILPRHWLTAVIWRIARIRHPGFKDFLITRFARAFDVDLDEVKLDVPDRLLYSGTRGRSETD
jgi:phosphatidylserine decarboxylase